MKQEALGHDLDDLAGFRSGHGRLEHRLVELRVESVALLRRNGRHAVLPEDGQEMVATLEENDIFLLGCPYTPEQLPGIAPAELSPYLYRVQKISSMYYTFRHHLAASLQDEEKEIRIQSFKAWERLQPVKVALNLAGKLNGQNNNL